jgi:pimeloyl-ACP methyl ester carboxylesterase
MNTVIPGVDPWQEVLANPYIWHFAFHSIPELPEQLVTGKEAAYFDYFFNILAGPAGVSKELRQQFTEAYLTPEALKTGFDWYRGFQQDVKDNTAVRDQVVEIPVLYLRGDHEHVKMEPYLKGLRDNGLHVEGAIIPNSGHFSPSENPEATVEELRKFISISESP